MPQSPPKFRLGSEATRRVSRAEAAKVYDRFGRRQKHGGFYQSREWTRLSKAHRAAHPLCVRCLAAGRSVVGDVADHIVPREVAPDRELDPSNLQTLCHQDHALKTAEDVKRYRL
jgi:5-methylcytosine-specific restriction protein A